MAHTIFVSYAKDDRAAVARLCTKLAARDIDVATDLIAHETDEVRQKADEVRQKADEVRQKALDTATHIVLVISPASTASTQVQSDIKRALRDKKPVIPVLLADTEIPDRWLALQPLDLRGGGTVEAVGLDSLVKRLPQKSVVQLKQWLETPDQAAAIRALILRDRLRWLIGNDALTPAGYLSLPETHELRSTARLHTEFGAVAQRTHNHLQTGNQFWYFYGTGGPGDELTSYIGKVVARLDDAPDTVRTIPWWFPLKMLGEKQLGALRLGQLHTGTETGSANCAIFAFLSPYDAPFAEDGTPSADLTAVLGTIRAQIAALDPLVPEQPFTRQVFIRVYLVAGRDPQLKTPHVKEAHVSLRKQWPQELLPGQTALTMLKIVSYDRLSAATEAGIPLMKYG
ncbi:MAG: toll/interleukin-1 receptor domain-containing protein [Anaerolineae bacterium]|nr:toll/interleukin-1 receptor domain-containing protein [Anaerolineae bacterium]